MSLSFRADDDVMRMMNSNVAMLTNDPLPYGGAILIHHMGYFHDAGFQCPSRHMWFSNMWCNLVHNFAHDFEHECERLLMRRHVMI